MESVFKLVSQTAATILFCLGVSSFLVMSNSLDRLTSATKKTVVVEHIMHEEQAYGGS